jgi:hypothetical protein
MKIRWHWITADKWFIADHDSFVCQHNSKPLLPAAVRHIN